MKSRLSLLIAAAAVSFYCAAAPVLASEKVGVSAAVRGNVLVKTGGAARGARAGESMLLGDGVATKADSGLQILLLDETTFTVGANVEMVIDEFVYDPAQHSGKVGATVTKGALRYVSGLISKDNPDNIKLRTPGSTISFRGTTGDVITGPEAIRIAKLLGIDTTGADPKTATFVFLRGPGEDKNTIDRQGQVTVKSNGGSVSLDKAGYGTFVPSKDLPPQPPVLITDDIQRLIEDLLRGKGQQNAQGGQNLFGSGGSAPDTSGQTGVEGRPFATTTDPLYNSPGMPQDGFTTQGGINVVLQDPCHIY